MPFMFDYKEGKQYFSKEGSYSTVLVSLPMASLMIEQVSRLQERGVKAGSLTGHDAISDHLVVKACSNNIESFIFSCPEGIIGVERWREVVLRQYC